MARDTASSFEPGGILSSVVIERPQYVLGFDEVRRLLPQQFPMIMVDRVLAVEPGKTIQTCKNISGNDLMLIGHFPDMAIFPGALLIEGAAQSSILLQKLSNSGEGKMQHYLFGSAKARFIATVHPGDQVIFHVALTTAHSFMATFLGEATVCNKPVLRCELTMALREKGRE
jgi:3-hydroxyacyl-[acyl-carrier-protein] dehydratase